MFYHTLSIKGFGNCSSKKSYTFPQGVTYISGANGSGKSTIMDAIQWCLFGSQHSSRTTRDRTSIIHTSSQSAVVSLALSHESYGDVDITRSLTKSGKHTLNVYIGGVEVEGGITESQEVISQMLSNLRGGEFHNVLMMNSSPTQASSAFLSSSPTQRRELLYYLVDPMQDYASTNKSIKKALREEKKEVSRLEGVVDTYTAMVRDVKIPPQPENSLKEVQEEYDAVLSKLSILSDDDVVGKKKSLNNSLHSAKESYESSCSRVDDLVEHKEELNETLYQVDKDISKEEKRLEKMRKAQGNVSSHMNMVNYALNFAETKKSNAQRGITYYQAQLDKNDLIRSLFDGSTTGCPVCGNSDYDADHHVDFDDAPAHECLESEKTLYDSAVEEINMYIAILEKDRGVSTTVHDMELCLDSLLDRKDAILRSIQDVDKQITQAHQDVKVKKNMVADITSELDNLSRRASTVDDAAYQELKDRETELMHTLVDIRSTLSEIDAATQRLDDYTEKLKKAQEEESWAITRKEQLDVLAAQTSPNGVISEKISELMDDIAEKSSDVYRYAFGDTPTITIEDVSTKGEPSCMVYCNDRDVTTYSHGEQLRLFCAIQGAMISVMNERNDVWIPPMWDEPSIAVDQSSVSDIFSIADYVSPEGHQFIIITRDDIPEEVPEKNIIRL